MLLLQLFDINKSAPAPNMGPELKYKIFYFIHREKFKNLTLDGNILQMVFLQYEIVLEVNLDGCIK